MPQVEVELNNGIQAANVVTVGVPVVGAISLNGDQDWYAFYLTAGTPYQFDLKGSMTGGGTLSDPFLKLFNFSGTPIATDDDGSSRYDSSSGHITDSQIVFIPSESGTYYLVANGFDNVLGSYQLTSRTLDTDYYIRGVLNDPVASWNGGQMAASPVTVTFSFPTTLPSGFLAGDLAGFAAFNEAQKAATRHALQDIADLTRINFVEVADGAGQIRFATTDQVSSGGVTYWDSTGMLLTSADIALDNSNSTNSNVSSGSYGYMALVHEIGHALGLKHPGDYNAGGGGTLPPYLPTSQDASPYTIESYNFTTAYLDLSSSAYKYVKTMMTFDVAALQMVYGVNTDTRSDNNSYAFDTAAMYTIWDGGGTDTLDASAWGTAGVSINLNAGALSYSGLLGADTLDTKLAPCVAIAFDCVIENAIGTSKEDIILGNSADNVLSGGLGDDRIEGGLGNDFLDGGAGNNMLIGNVGEDHFALLLGATNTIMDFTPGLGGDALYLTDLLANLRQFTTGNNPFSAGYLKFVQRGADTQLWVDTDGTGSVQIFVTAAVLKDVDASIIVATNVDGFLPDTAATGGVNISGTASEDQTITAISTLADIDGMGVLRYQWQSSLNGTVWVDIGTTVDDHLTLGDALVGQHIRVIASYVDGHGVTESVTSDQTVVVVNVNDLPTGAVTISGTATQGQTLTAANTLADIDGIPATGAGAISYQWQAGGVDITGATGSTLVLGQVQVSKPITVVAQYTDAQGTTESVASSATVNVLNVNDASTGLVTITGTATQNLTLTVSNTLADTDGIPTTGAGAISYQWKAGGVDIAGATSNTLVLDQAQVSKAITVVAQYTDAQGTTESVASSATTNVANVNDLPTGTVTIIGTATQGQTLTAANTLVDIDGIPAAGTTGAISYQWKAGGVDIAGATGRTLVLSQAQVFKAIAVVAQYTDAQGTTENVASSATTNVVNVNDAPTGAVTISGTATQGQTLTAANTLADLDVIPEAGTTGAISYQWKAGGVDITGATGSTLVLDQAQVSKAIAVVAQYTDAQGTAESVVSSATNNVLNVNDLPTGMVTISGTATQGQTLTASNTLADIDGIPAAGTTGAISYQWRAGGVDISGATGTTLVLSQTHVLKAITVVAQYTDAQGTTETVASSATTNVVNVNDAPTGLVTITGTATQNQTLTASNTLADIDGIPAAGTIGAISYQWQAGGVDISGATGTTLVLSQTHVSKAITVVVQYADAQGTSESVASDATNSVNPSLNVDLLAYSWKAHTLLSGVSVTAGPLPVTHVTDADGRTTFVGFNDPVLTLTVARVVPDIETVGTGSAVNLQDAIAILKMIVGLDVNGAGKALSPYQSMAADFDGNGTVDLTDAIGVLKNVVGLSAPEPIWHFVNEVDASVPGKVGLNPGLPQTTVSANISGSNPVHVGLVGYLSGDVDGSFAGAAGATSLNASYFTQLLADHSTLNPSQFGIYG